MAGKATEETNPDLGGRIITFGNMPSYSNRGGHDSCREHKLQTIKRQGPPTGSSQSDEDVRQSEKGILKKPYSLMTQAEKEKWAEDSHSDTNDALSQSENNGEAECQVTEVERTLNSLNGYHEDIIDALKRAASHRAGTHPLVGAPSLSSDELRTIHREPYPRFSSAASTTGEFPRLKSSHEKLVDSGGEDDQVPSVGTIRIRNLEDLIRQLEHPPARHMSPSGSEEIRMSETEADRHYRLDASSCTESQGRGRADNPMAFVYGRYRQPPGSVASGSGSTSGGRSSDRLAPVVGGLDFSDGGDSHGVYTEEDDLDRGDGGDAADSESDEFVVLPKGLRSQADHYFWPLNK